MSYTTLRDNLLMDPSVSQIPSPYFWKDNPLSNNPLITSNLAGIQRPISVYKSQTQILPDKPYEYAYQTCCNLNLPKSPEYTKLREVIFAP